MGTKILVLSCCQQKFGLQSGVIAATRCLVRALLADCSLFITARAMMKQNTTMGQELLRNRPPLHVVGLGLIGLAGSGSGAKRYM